jgi:phosphoglycolate phosphatase
MLCGIILVGEGAHMIKGIIFDLDGTLLNTIDDIADSMNFALKQHGFYEFVNDEYKYFVGKGVHQLVNAVLEDQTNDEQKKNKVLSAYLRKYAELQNNKTKPYPGIEALLIDLNLREIKLAVLSNKPDQDTQKVVKRYFPTVAFDAIFGAQDAFPIKPHPAGANAIVKRFDCKPNEVLYVGDTNVDMLTAQNAKLIAVGALWGFRTEGELRKAKANYIIQQPKELLDIIKEING